ncbi:MAG TPA: aldo/keto reductase, partial [Candidatus Binataceae bacterium]|nr:aldo/keto reductase [Candidatus Binataceae bacterium]
RLPFGKTGHLSSRVIFGAAALWHKSQDEADRLLELLLEYSINHIDTAAQYGDSELRVGAWMREHRDRFFLATKTGERTYQGARAGLHRSLERLRVAQVDLIQLHNLVEEDEWQIALGPGGALEALVEARAQGLVRFIGVTGHGTRIAAMHRRSLERFAFDSVLLPYNYPMLSQPQYAADVAALLGVCRARGVAIQTIKSVARRRWQNLQDPRKASWYEPLRDPAAVARAVNFVLAQPDLFLNSSSDTAILRDTLEAAGAPLRLPEPAAMEADVANYQMTPLFAPGALERI